MKEYIEILKKCPLFFGIEENNLIKMLNCLGAKIESFDKKYTVFAEGNSAKYIGIVLRGNVQVIQLDYYGNRNIIGNFSTTQMFLEAFACAQTESIPVSVIATEPTDIMLIDCSHILHTCSNNCSFHQQLIFNLMKDLAQKTIVFHEKIEITSKRTTKDKLMAYLLIQAKKANSNSFTIPFDRQELADYLQVDRSGLSAEISKLRNEGIIKCHRSNFTLL